MRDPETIEEELALFAEAIEAGIDPFPEPKKETPWARYAVGLVYDSRNDFIRW